MYKKHSLVYLVLIFLAASACQISANTINLYLKPAPLEIQESVRNELTDQGLIEKKLANLSKKGATGLGRKFLKNGFKKLLPKTSGFLAIYGGYIDYSNKDGKISFPLLHKEPKIYLIITPRINIATLFENTISHEQYVEGVKSKVFLFEKKKNGPNRPADDENIFYWQVSQVEKPEHRRISPISMIILTSTKNIVVPTGDFMSADNVNLVLPHIYIVGNTGNAETILNFLDSRRFFEQIRESERVVGAVEQKIVENS